MKAEPSPSAGNKNLLMGAAVATLSLPVVLFTAGWYTHFVFIAVTATAVMATYHACKPVQGDETALPRKHILSLLGCAGIVALFLAIGGMVGYFPTHGDSWAFRQALYTNLLQEDWPLVLPNGREMTYYLAGMLPPAALAKLLPDSMQQLPILLFTTIPVVLALGLYFKKWGYVSWLFLILALGFQDPLCAFFRPNGTFSSGMGATAQYLQDLYQNHGCDWRILTSFYGNKTMLAPIHNCVGAYNSVPYTLLAAAVIMTAGKRKWLVPYTMAMLAFVSPLGAIALFPLAACEYLRERELKLLPLCIECAAPAVLAALAAVYYGRTETGPSVILPAWEVWGSKFWIFYVRYLLGASLLIVPLITWRRREPAFWVTAASAALLPLLFIGTPPDGGVYQGFNELTLKGTVVYTLVLGSMWKEDWEHVKPWIKIPMFCWVLIATAGYLGTQCIKFDWNHRVADMWNGHLNHDRAFLHQSVPGAKEALLPGILIEKDKRHESAAHYLLPEAPGADYSKTPDPRAFD